MSANNIVEDLFKSISTIVEKRIANLDYDKTIVCTITDISNAEKQNLYTVTDGSTTFQAQGDGGIYAVNDQVRVLIVNGDFTKEKYIQGKHSSDGETIKPITYVSPLSSVLKITDNLLSSNTLEAGITANGSKKEIPIADIEFKTNEVQNSDIFDTLFIQAEFQTNFDQYDMRNGDYGLHLKLISQKINEDKTTSYDVYGLNFSATRDMFGNPYAFKIFTLQEIKYALNQWPENLIGLQLWLYQDNNFDYVDETKKNTNNQITKYVAKKIGDTEIFDIRVKNIVVGFGSEVTAIENNKVQIYTNDLKTYYSDDGDDDKRDINLLWYNRDTNNKYLGFSDGRYDTAYDEDTYLQASSKNTRLLQRQSSLYLADQISLSLLADMYDIKTQSKQATNIIGINLNQTLQGFKNYTFGINWNNDNPFATLLGVGDGSLGKYSTNIESAVAELGEYYDTTLQYAKDNKKTLKPLHEDVTSLQSQIETLQTAISTNLTGVKNAVNTILTKVAEKTISKDATYPSYADVYETYNARLTKLLNELDDIKNKIEGLAAADPSPIIQPTEEKEETETTTPSVVSEPATGSEKTEEVEEKEPTYLTNEAELLKNNTNAVLLNKIVSGKLDLTKYRDYADLTITDNFKDKYDNKYCIYWYRYDKTFLGKDAHAPEGWQRLSSLNNSGLPGSDEQKKDPHYKPKSDLKAITIELDAKQEEKFMAIVFANHKKFISNELVFTNLTPIPDITSIDATGSLFIEHYKRGEVCNSRNSYQLYDSNGMLINAAETQYKREIRARFASKDKGDEQLIGAYIYWYVPTTATMLEVFKLDVDKTYHQGRTTIYYSEDELFKAKDKGVYRASGTNVLKVGNDYKFCFIEKNEKDEDVVVTISIPEAIYETSDELEEANTASAQLVKVEDTAIYYEIYKYDNEKKIWIDTGKSIDDLTTVLFDTAIIKPGYNCYYKLIGQNDDGSIKIDDTIFPYHIKNYYQQTATQNTILCVVKKDANTYQTSQSFEFTSYGNSGTDYTLALIPTLEYPFVAGDKALSVGVTLYDADQKNIVINIPAAQWLGPTGYTAQAVEDSGYTIIKDDSDLYAGILKCELKDIEIEELNQNITLTSYLPIPYGNTENLYIEGASTILYDSNGSNPQYYKKPYKLYNKLDNTELSNITWLIKYYCKSNLEYDSKSFNEFWLTSKTESEKNITYIHFNYNGSEHEYQASSHPDLINIISLQYLPRLDSSNTIIPSGMYITYPNDEKAIYPVVFAQDEEKNIKWAQPLLISQNTYSSAVLNKWNGELSMDEKSGTILSTMVGAGRKNEQNQFEGILMGDVGTASGDDAIATTGLYGFHNGAQSFGFKIDGTAFLGKSSSGRIEFNGDTGVIQSANFDGVYDQNGNLTTLPTAGMRIDLDDGKIDAYNFALRANSTKGYLELSSDPDQMLKMIYSPDPDDETLDVTVLEVNTKNYLLQSFNYSDDFNGMQIDIGNGKIGFYDSNLPPEEADTKAIILNVEGAVPFMVGNPSSPAFKLKWDGSLQIGGGATPAFQINSQGDLAIGAYSEEDKSYPFYISHEGTMYANSVQISGNASTPSYIKSVKLDTCGLENCYFDEAKGLYIYREDGTQGRLQSGTLDCGYYTYEFGQSVVMAGNLSITQGWLTKKIKSITYDTVKVLTTASAKYAARSYSVLTSQTIAVTEIPPDFDVIKDISSPAQTGQIIEDKSEKES